MVKRSCEQMGENAMELKVPADLETLINKRISSGAYSSAEDVLRRALEAQDAQESWTEEEGARFRRTSNQVIDRQSAGNLLRGSRRGARSRQ